MPSRGSAGGGKSSGGGKAPRKVREVAPRTDERWEIKQRGADRAERVIDTKKEAVKEATQRARKEWQERGQPSQVVIKNEDGTIQEERTYGKDPHPPKG